MITIARGGKYITLLCDVQWFSGSNVDVDKFCFACIKTQMMLRLN